MEDTAHRAIAIVGVGAILPDAPTAPAFWENLKRGRYSISEVTPDRWDPALYYDADPKAPDKSYSKIGGFVRAYDWDPTQWKLPVPPRVAAAMDETQKWAVAATRAALQSYGWPDRPLCPERTAVILGNAMAGEKHYMTALRINFPEIARELQSGASFAALPAEVREKVAAELRSSVGRRYPEITEDTMPGELANCMAGRIANLFNFHGPNYVCDAACASALAAISAASEGLLQRDFDAAITGGVDRNMGASTYVKFCKIGALSATGTRPYADGADGFVMGEGTALFVLKRLEDAERDGDRILAVLRGIGAASDGRGKGITAPNPVGQKLAVERAWTNAGLPASIRLVRRGSRHVDPRGRRGRGGKPDRGLRPRHPAAVDTARLREVQHRSPEGRGGSGGSAEDGLCPAREGAASQPQLRRPEPQHRLRARAVLREHGAQGLARSRLWRAPCRSERLRLRGHQLPRRARGARPRPSEVRWQGPGRR